MTAHPASYPSLRTLLNRTLFRIAVLVLCASVIGLIAANKVINHNNLQLMARTLGYTTEAAIVFGDAEAAAEALESMKLHENLGTVQIYDRHKQLLLDWHNPSTADASAGSWKAILATALQPQPVRLPITHGNSPAGELVIASRADQLSPLLCQGMLFILASLSLAILVTLFLTNRIIRLVGAPLNNLSQVAYKVRYERNFSARVPPAKVAELNEFCEDFNELLKELQHWNLLQEKEKAILNHQASHDSLTGLANRKHFEHRLKHAWRSSNKYDTGLALFYIDTDHFKQINDQYGHDDGDVVLRAVAQRLRQQVRANDVVARLGGDEFAVLLPDINSATDVKRIADSITQNMQQPVQLPDGRQINVSLSIGIALSPDDADHPAALIKAADMAMYAVKESGRGHWKRVSDVNDTTEELLP